MEPVEKRPPLESREQKSWNENDATRRNNDFYDEQGNESTWIRTKYYRFLQITRAFRKEEVYSFGFSTILHYEKEENRIVVAFGRRDCEMSRALNEIEDGRDGPAFSRSRSQFNQGRVLVNQPLRRLHIGSDVFLV